MSLRVRLVARTLFEMAATLLGWVLIAVAVVMFAMGRPSTGVELLVSGAVVFAVAAVSFRSMPTTKMVARAMNKTGELLAAGEYHRAADLAVEAYGGANASRDHAPLVPYALVQLALAVAATRDRAATREVLEMVNEARQSPAWDHSLDDAICIIKREHYFQVNSPARLVDEVQRQLASDLREAPL